ncbi:MAG TPA: deoxyribodipyrimidine photo-lyase [Chthoniobacteraceae bacterium]|jgi:deoxyribodipyrimidine photo-lyase|nr:deoxyribodipyrimidine photo-lyase [Chthoniobacteraceae bacterium]
MKRVIHWFRRDLRLHDNTALRAALAAAPEVIPIYILSGWQRYHHWTGSPRQQFLCGSLAVLAANLEKRGGRLIVRQGAADEELGRLAADTGAEAIFFNRDPDPFGRAMEEKLEKLGIPLRPFKDVAIHERDEVLTAQGSPYRVFTPYSKAWRTLPKPEVHAAPRKISTPGNLKSLPLPDLGVWGLKLDAEIIEPGEDAARRRLEAFVRGPVHKYAELRDFPAAAGASRLSQDLRYGLLSPREVFTRAGASHAYVNELIWREFYMQVLWHWPRVLDAAFDPNYDGVKWFEPGRDFDAWRNGETGFPIVDAAMRQLSATGFMHNRLRMIAAMFLTKDLHIHWREGESWFMRRLVDGEIASNNGGWQWSAGTGADAAPYFRIQNPWTQSARYDPKAEFIKQWVPELRDIHPAQLCNAPKPGMRICAHYPRPMVDHAKEREAALMMFRAKH